MQSDAKGINRYCCIRDSSRTPDMTPCTGVLNHYIDQIFSITTAEIYQQKNRHSLENFENWIITGGGGTQGEGRHCTVDMTQLQGEIICPPLEIRFLTHADRALWFKWQSLHRVHCHL